MTSRTLAQTRHSIEFPFHSVRNISSPEDLDSGRKIYVGHAPLSSILDLSTDENVRDYLLDAEGRQRRTPTQVNRAIRDTLQNTPEDFSVLNSGVTIVARGCDIDEKKKILLLERPGIINGSQTQGVIKDLQRDYDEESNRDFLSFHIKFEIVVTTDEDLIAEISIARNFQNNVMTISIAGRLGQFDELEQSLQAKLPGTKLQMSETELSDNHIKTELLLKVIAALVPEELWVKSSEFNKVYTYNAKATCLKDYRDTYKRAHDLSDSNHTKHLDLYQFYLDIIAEAFQLYNKWKEHKGFEGTRIRSIQREGRTILEVPDGIVFPILASLSAFAVKTANGWTIQPPKLFSDDELIKAAKSVYQEIAGSNPNTMGKSKACYSALYQISSIYWRLSRDSRVAENT